MPQPRRTRTGTQRNGITLEGFANLAAAICRRRRVHWRIGGLRVGMEVHRPNALTPYILHHATVRAREVKLDSMIPPWRFVHDERALLGLRLEATAGRLDAVATTVAASMYLHGLDEVLAAAEVAVREQPQWATMLKREDGWRVCDTQLITWMSARCYGERLGLGNANRSAVPEPLPEHGIGTQPVVARLNSPAMPLTPGS